MQEHKWPLVQKAYRPAPDSGPDPSSDSGADPSSVAGADACTQVSKHEQLAWLYLHVCALYMTTCCVFATAGHQ